MKITRLRALLLCLFISSPTLADSANPKARLTTDLGDIVLELYPQQAPKTVENFIDYAEAGFYNGTIFHRVIPGFVIQGGGYTFDFIKKATREPVVNESNNGLKNLTGTVSMARLPHPDSATSQFFINLADNGNLDASKRKPGYAVFAKVVDGMDVVKQIVRAPRGKAPVFKDAPNEPIRILSVSLEAANEN